MPARGSVQDRIVCEMLSRERKREIYKNVYLGRIFAAGLNMPEKTFQLWTELLALEIYHENYSPRVVDAKHRAIKTLEEVTKPNSQQRVNMFRKLQSIEVRDDAMRPLTATELASYKRKIRARRLKAAQKKKSK